MSTVRQLRQFGQGVWLDYLDDKIIDSGELLRYVMDDGVCGVTSNPAILKEAFASAPATTRNDDANSAYERRAVALIRRAADVLRTTHTESHGSDGYVSLEVSPHLAHDLSSTVEQAQRLHTTIDRPNVMIKVPATGVGLEAIRQLTAAGICTNATLIFDPHRYESVARAYTAGLQERAQRGAPLTGIASVASLFVSRIDTLVDRKLRGCAQPSCLAWAGQAAVATAKQTYRRYLALRDTAEWQRLEEAGAATQRVLWASTGTKDPAYSPVKYVEELIGPRTLTTLPRETLEQYRSLGHPGERLTIDLDEGDRVWNELSRYGISQTEVAAQLEVEGLAKFVDAYDAMLSALEAN